MIEPKYYTYDDFPKHQDNIEGSKTIICERLYNVRWTQDVVYCQRVEKDLHMEILEPMDINEEIKCETRNCQTKFPAILYIPGSAWHKQDMKRLVPELYQFAKRGYFIALLEYRDTSTNTFPSQVLDAKKGIEYLKENADRYCIDKNNIFLWGDSSGGHTALIAGLTQHHSLIESDGDYTIRGIIDYFAPTDISCLNDRLSTMNLIHADDPVGQLIGGYDVLKYPELVKPTQVKEYLNYEIPILIFHGNKDRQVPLHQSSELYKELKRKKWDCEFYILDNADHGGSAFWENEVLNIIDNFIMQKCL